ncbi:MAG TPA: hypothetical protein VHK91_06995 [Flavisolibacter sp.]|jgi:hypothetical protein|nr:hypothetical protein [Flavisolibacter sp.]
MTRTIKFLSGLALLFFITSCQKEISVESGSPARGSLLDDAGDCMPKVIGGNYIVNKTLTDSNYIDVTVEVGQTGRYTIVTDTVNGYTFKGSGNFSTTGQNTVRLKGSGKPLQEGTDNFTVIFDTTFCVVAVTVLPAGTTPPPPGPASGSYFPMTENSYWTYDDPDKDTLKTVVSGAEVFLGNSYQRFITTYEDGSKDTSFYRKDPSSNFYNYVPVSDIIDPSIPIVFAKPGLDVLFLRELLKTGDVFNSDHSATLAGQAVTLRFQNTVVNANASITVNGKNYTNVYQIETVPKLGAVGMFSDVGDKLVFYFAKGVGLIRIENSLGESQNLRFYSVL